MSHPAHRPETETGPPGRGLRSNLPTLLLLVLILFFLFSARIIYSPLLLTIEEDLGLGHAEAASFFLFITIGYAGMMIFSGFVAAAFGHRSTIALAVLLVIVGLVWLSFSSSLWSMRAALILVGTGAGLYFPSGIPTLTSLVDAGDEGKALAIHEVGPNSGFIIVPIAAVFALRFMSWQGVLLVLACLGIAAGLLFLLLGKGGRFHGKPPHLSNVRLILGKPSFWVTTVLFALGSGAAIGVFAMTPTYLVAERGMNPELVNTLVGVSRASSLPMIFVAGYLVDRFGARRIITAVMLTAGTATAAMALSFRPLLIAAVFLQPALIACFFPAGFTVISRIAPREMHNLTISFMFPMGYSVGSGVVPLFLGVLGDRLTFSFGFLLYGALLVCGAALPFALKLETGGNGDGNGIKKTKMR
ncbi:MAG: MFS transporter [Spirochaetales bacterium]|nr:MFS transporter [Spirochaetales bacterium]